MDLYIDIYYIAHRMHVIFEYQIHQFVCMCIIYTDTYPFYLLADSDIAMKLQVLKQNYAKIDTLRATLFALMTDLKC